MAGYWAGAFEPFSSTSNPLRWSDFRPPCANNPYANTPSPTQKDASYGSVSLCLPARERDKNLIICEIYHSVLRARRSRRHYRIHVVRIEFHLFAKIAHIVSNALAFFVCVVSWFCQVVQLWRGRCNIVMKLMWCIPFLGLGITSQASFVSYMLVLFVCVAQILDLLASCLADLAVSTLFWHSVHFRWQYNFLSILFIYREINPLKIPASFNYSNSLVERMFEINCTTQFIW